MLRWSKSTDPLVYDVYLGCATRKVEYLVAIVRFTCISEMPALLELLQNADAQASEISKWRALYHTARNERDILLAERAKLRGALGRFSEWLNWNAGELGYEWNPLDGDPEHPAVMAGRALDGNWEPIED